jgi:hypothetical protein
MRFHGSVHWPVARGSRTETTTKPSAIYVDVQVQSVHVHRWTPSIFRLPHKEYEWDQD